MNFCKTSRLKKALIVISTVLASPLAQAHDSSHLMSLSDHFLAHVIEFTSTNTVLLLGTVILAVLAASVFFARTRPKTHA